MRRTPYVRALTALAVMIALSISVSARPRDEQPIREPKETLDPIVRTIKRIVKSLGDGMTIPTP